jgi:hypothetical protein
MVFQIGQSGNPNGRPRTSSPRWQLRQMIQDELPDIIRVVIEQAKGGDMQAAKILIDRALPALKPEAAAVGFVVADNDKLTDMSRTVLDMATRGELSADEAIGLMKVLTQHCTVLNEARVIAGHRASDKAHDAMMATLKAAGIG